MHQTKERAVMGDAERQTRIELAACYRLAAHYKMTDTIYTHISARVPGEPGHFLINPYGLMWEEITASSLVKIDVDGNKVETTPYRVNPAGFTIHSAVHMASDTAEWVMHTHTRAGIAVSCLEDGILPLNQIALQYYGRIGYHDFTGIALDLEERADIAKSLGDNIGLVLRNHGLVSVGRNAAEMFSTMFYLCRVCEIQEATLAMGAPLRAIDKNVVKRVREQFDGMALDDGDLQLEWEAYMRLADRLDPGFRD
ncbi:class II aldolase/adducin family protein [Rhodospirillum sp. A1_3_36]|uniref:class II aldolase/adducin family protein n=1 Tax=Rhodospirillum sp. A1_3_36 TaxID=3391666 RepID=UPI0039A40CAF